jgi:hypothetical protein
VACGSQQPKLVARMACFGLKSDFSYCIRCLKQHVAPRKNWVALREEKYRMPRLHVSTGGFRKLFGQRTNSHIVMANAIEAYHALPAFSYGIISHRSLSGATSSTAAMSSHRSTTAWQPCMLAAPFMDHMPDMQTPSGMLQDACTCSPLHVLQNCKGCFIVSYPLLTAAILAHVCSARLTASTGQVTRLE